MGLLKTGFITTASARYRKNMTTITAVSVLIRAMSIVVNATEGGRNIAAVSSRFIDRLKIINYDSLRCSPERANCFARYRGIYSVTDSAFTSARAN